MCHLNLKKASDDKKVIVITTDIFSHITVYTGSYITVDKGNHA